MRIRYASILTILAVLAGAIWIVHPSCTPARRNAEYAKHLKCVDEIKSVARGLDEYKSRYGRYPELPTWIALISADSPLVQENFIPSNFSEKDLWGQAYSAVVTRNSYHLRYEGNIRQSSQFAPFELEAK